MNDDKGLLKMSKYLHDNWTVFEGEELWFKEPDNVIYCLKHKWDSERTCSSLAGFREDA